MQKPRFKTSDKAAWVFIHTRLRPPTRRETIDRRTATRCGYMLSASRMSGRAERDLPLPFVGETVSSFVARVTKK